MIATRNLLVDIPPAGPEEAFEALLERPGVKLERIISQGHATPPGQYYDQAQDEWVMVLSGAAKLTIEGRGLYELGPGDSIFLPAHCRHRVEWTHPKEPTIWLALHLWPGNPEDNKNGTQVRES